MSAHRIRLEPVGGRVVRRTLSSFSWLVACAVLVGWCAPLAAQTEVYVALNGDTIGRYDGGSTSDASFISLNGVTGVAVGSDGTIYANTGVPNPGSVYSYSSSGAAVASPFVNYTGGSDSVFNPQGMAFGPGGNLYIADAGGGGVIQVYNSSGANVSTLTSPGTPTAVAFSGGLLYAASGSSIERYNGSSFTSIIQAGFGPSSTPALPGVSNISSLAFGPDNKLYALDIGSNSSASTGPAIWQFTLDANGDPTATSEIVNFFGSVGGDFFTPSALAFGPNGHLYVSGESTNNGDGEIWQFNTDGTFDGTFVTGLTNPGFLAFAPVPEPASVALVCGAAILCAAAWRRRRVAK